MSHFVCHFGTSTSFREKCSDHFKDLHKLTLLTHFDIILTSFLGGTINYGIISNSFLRWCQNNIKLCQELQFIIIFKMIRGFSLNGVEVLKSCKMWYFMPNSSPWPYIRPKSIGRWEKRYPTAEPYVGCLNGNEPEESSSLWFIWRSPTVTNLIWGVSTPKKNSKSSSLWLRFIVRLFSVWKIQNYFCMLFQNLF